MFRNLVSMDVEESIRANPIDAVVLMCAATRQSVAGDGRASCDVPTIVISGGPMLNGRYRGEAIGSGTVVWQFSEASKPAR